MTHNRSRYLPTRSPAPPPVVPGLGPDSLAGLSPAAADARAVAAAEREASADRRAAARRLAERVEAATPPVRRSTATGPTDAPNGAQAPRPERGTDSSADAPARRPWRDAPLVVRTRRADPASLTPDDLAALGRLLAHAPHRNPNRTARKD